MHWDCWQMFVPQMNKSQHTIPNSEISQCMSRQKAGMCLPGPMCIFTQTPQRSYQTGPIFSPLLLWATSVSSKERESNSHIPSLSVAVRDSSSLLPLSRSLLGVPDSVSLLPVSFESVRTGLMGPVGMNDGTLNVGWLWVVFISARNGRKQLDYPINSLIFVFRCTTFRYSIPLWTRPSSNKALSIGSAVESRVDIVLLQGSLFECVFPRFQSLTQIHRTWSLSLNPLLLSKPTCLSSSSTEGTQWPEELHSEGLENGNLKSCVRKWQPIWFI